jgi:hypothetical protein
MPMPAVMTNPPGSLSTPKMIHPITAIIPSIVWLAHLSARLTGPRFHGALRFIARPPVERPGRRARPGLSLPVHGDLRSGHWR